MWVKQLLRRFIPDVILKRYSRYRQLRILAKPPHLHKTLDCFIAYNEYGAYCIPHQAQYRNPARTILQGKVYEPETIAFIRQHHTNRDVIHAGAYFGDFLPAIAPSRDDDVYIHAFEPILVSYECAQITCLLNHLSNIQLHNVGLGDEAQTVEMTIEDAEGRYLGGGSYVRGYKNSSLSAQSVQAKIVRLDDIIPQDRNIGIIHLDVERFETQALAGAMAIIARCRPLIIVETLPPEVWLRTNLYAIGYERRQKTDRNYVLAPL